MDIGFRPDNVNINVRENRSSSSEFGMSDTQKCTLTTRGSHKPTYFLKKDKHAEK